MVVAAMALLPGFLIGTPAVFKRCRVAWGYLRKAAMWLMLLGFAWYAVAKLKRWRTIPIERWLAGILPASRPQLAMAAVAIVGACYWIAYKGFCRMEIPPRRLQIQRPQ